MKVTAGRPQSVGRAVSAGRPHPVEPGRVPFTSSLVLSLVLHGALVLWLLGSAWLLSRAQPYRLASHTVFLAGDSPVASDQVLGEGGGVSGAKQEGKEPGEGSKSAPADAGTAPSVEKFAPPVEKPVPPPPKPAVDKTVVASPPKPVVEKAAPPPPKPVVEKAAPPAPIPKPVVEKAVPAPPKLPPEAMALAQKETKPSTPPAPPISTPSEAQQKLAKLRERRVEQETAETARQEAAKQRVASLRAEQAEKQVAQQRVAALRARVGSGSSGEGSDSSGSGTGNGATGTGSGAPGGGRGTGAAGAGGVGTGGLSGIRMRTYREELQSKIENAWNIPAQSKGLKAVFFLSINRAGRVEQARLVQGSGNALFDESLQRAIQQAQPFPAVPEDFPAPTYDVPLNFQDRR